ncbi:cell division protein PerM [Streptacidiphilus fuscans]|uniref:Integral membrane protein n=1 Tax=Streptacidiphilus fuscans TaxID=2789292 RepID=A0A931AYL6_9ACTN|nr:DUF6350 family protein [Streptacidiphilus fuscans]MBF9067829.1 hypothetical protein [Streptacidiphilus fuscans]
MANFDRPALLAGAAAAVTGWGLVAVPVFLLWVVTPYADDSLFAVPRLAGGLWLLGHGGPLRWEDPVGVATLGVAPLAVTALAVVLVHQAAARTGRIGSVVAGYATVGFLVSLLALGGALQSEPLPDLLWVVLTALPAAMTGARRRTGEWGIAAAWAALRARGQWLGIWPVVAPEGRFAATLARIGALAPYRDRALRAGAAGALALLGCGGLVLTVALLVHLSAVGGLAAQLAPDVPGRLGLLLLCAVLLPNAAVWSASWALGPGFTLSAHAAATGTQALPPIAFPLLAIAPGPGRSVLGLVALLTPVVSGAVVGWALGRDSADLPGFVTAAMPVTAASADEPARTGRWELAVTVVCAAVCTAGIAAAVALWAGGALGDVALAHVGPPVGWTALAAFGWTAGAGLPAAYLHRWWAGRAERAARRSAERAAQAEAATETGVGTDAREAGDAWDRWDARAMSARTAHTADATGLTELIGDLITEDWAASGTGTAEETTPARRSWLSRRSAGRARPEAGA